ncbi:MAG: family 31 glucosidase, partial [Anaerolineae bacterium]|nr:family 31 glucosidase [Anaerolineae bacterium]
MYGFHQQDGKLVWEQNHEKVQIEPWGRDSLRVRATMNAAMRDDLPSALLEPPVTESYIEIGDARALIRNGKIAAEVSLLTNATRFFNPVTGAEYL